MLDVEGSMAGAAGHCRQGFPAPWLPCQLPPDRPNRHVDAMRASSPGGVSVGSRTSGFVFPSGSVWAPGGGTETWSLRKSPEEEQGSPAPGRRLLALAHAWPCSSLGAVETPAAFEKMWSLLSRNF